MVAIVGRPNVGKSTLFNRLIGERLAIISDVSGTTRDRVYGTSEWAGRTFTVVDTGGLELEPGTDIEERVQEQARVAVEEADLILFVVDAHAGIAPLDHEVADRLRRADAPVILVINKGDNPAREADAVEFFALGFDPSITIRHSTAVTPATSPTSSWSAFRHRPRPRRRYRSQPRISPRRRWPSSPRPSSARRGLRSSGGRIPGSRRS